MYCAYVVYTGSSLQRKARLDEFELKDIYEELCGISKKLKVRTILQITYLII